MKKKLKIVFMGTPDFAACSLKALKENSFDVVLVVTQPDRPKGRGRKLVCSPVKELALRLGHDVIQPVSIKTREINNCLANIEHDLIVAVAFGQVLPKGILELPKNGAINIHASLLPKYRGSAPIQWAIIKGDKETGVTAMLMDKGLDTGDILLSAKVKIATDDTSATLHDRLAVLGAELLIKTLKGFEQDTIKPVPQNHAKATYAPLLKKSDGRIEWKMSSEAIDAFIRGVTPWPGAFTFHKKKRLKIFMTKPVMADVSEAPGTVVKGFSDELRVAAGTGAISILEIQGESGKRLLIKDFLHGYKISPGTILR